MRGKGFYMISRVCLMSVGGHKLVKKWKKSNQRNPEQARRDRRVRAGLRRFFSPSGTDSRLPEVTGLAANIGQCGTRRQTAGPGGGLAAYSWRGQPENGFNS